MTKERAKRLMKVAKDVQASQEEAITDFHEAINDVQKGLLLFESCVRNMARCNGLLADALKKLVKEGDADD